MPKPLTSNDKGLSRKNSITRILPRSTTQNQVVPELSYYINRRRFTDSLELLEKRGITGDTARFIIANLQSIGGEK